MVNQPLRYETFQNSLAFMMASLGRLVSPRVIANSSHRARISHSLARQLYQLRALNGCSYEHFIGYGSRRSAISPSRGRSFSTNTRLWNNGGQDETSAGPNTKLQSTLAQTDSSDLVAPVRITPDPLGVLPSDHPALSILGNSSLVIQRQLEMMNVMLGFEQANRYIIMDGNGQTLGYIAEQDHGIGQSMARQVFRTHRSFTTHIFDRQEREVLRIHRPFAYINSRIRIYDPIMVEGEQGLVHTTALQGTSASSAVDPNSTAQLSSLSLDQMRIIGEAQQQWAPLRRKYNLFTYRPFEKLPTGSRETLQGEDVQNKQAIQAEVSDQAIEAGMEQFAHVNEPFLSWDFSLRNESGHMIGSVNRNFAGFAREIFTDTGVYALRMDVATEEIGSEIDSSQHEAATQMTLDQRAVMLATAVSIDFDYFSRHSHAGHGGFMPIWFPWGGAAAEGAGAAGAAGEARAVVGAAETAGIAGAAGAAGRGVAAGGVSDGAIAGAGTMAGYEAMQRGIYGQNSSDNPSTAQRSLDPQSPVAPDGEEIFDPDNQSSRLGDQTPEKDDSWWRDHDDKDQWGGPPNSGGSSSGGSGDGGGGGGGGLLDSISEFFGD